MAIKVDLAKAYDHLEWSFIHKVLKAFHFPQMLIDLIMSCVSTTSISILFNGRKLDSFKPLRGIRQGVPYPHTCSSFAWNILGPSLRRNALPKGGVR